LREGNRIPSAGKKPLKQEAFTSLDKGFRQIWRSLEKAEMPDVVLACPLLTPKALDGNIQNHETLHILAVLRCIGVGD
jgi:hypothetical protein